MKTLVKSLLLFLCLILCEGIASAQSGFVDVAVNTEKSLIPFSLPQGHSFLP